MFFFRRILPYIIGATVPVEIWVILTRPRLTPWVVIAEAVVMFIGVGIIAGWGKRLNEWRHIAFTVSFFAAGGSFFITFIETPLLSYALSLYIAVFSALFLEHLFRFIERPSLYRPYALEYTGLVMQISAFYFVSASLFGLRTFVRDAIPLWALGIIEGVSAAFLAYSALWMGKVRDSEALRLSLIGGWALAALFVAHAWLPAAYTVLGALLAVWMYLLLGLWRSVLLQKLSKPVLVRYLAFGAAAMFILLITARWI
ncbi:MAG: hypothetical protein AAB886_02380 [Patescibacteria group bacterium]